MALTKIQGGVIKNTAQLSISSINATGVITAASFSGDGSNISGVSGFATALSPSTASPLNQIFKTSKTLHIGAGVSISVEVGENDGSTAFTRASDIVVSSGATFRIASGTVFITNILGVF